MINNSQNEPNPNNLTPPTAPPAPPIIPTPPAPSEASPANGGASTQAPIFQASPTGGVVATLQPGQTGFSDLIQTESDRKDGFVLQDTTKVASQSHDNTLKQVSTANVDYSHQSAPTPEEPVAPKSVRNLRIGKEKKLPSRKKNWLFPVMAVAIALILIGFAGYYFWDRSQNTPAALPPVVETTVLEYWGLWEPSSTLTQVLKDFETLNPGVSVRYSKKSINDYRTTLQSALASGNGPDVFRYHASWRSFLQDSLDPMPASVMPSEQFALDFYPVFSTELANDAGQIQGMPLMYDSLALVYNKDLLAAANLEAPKTWNEFAAAAATLTEKDASGVVQQAGAAMGLASNVDFASDIIGLLALQNGINLQNPDPAKMAEVLTYYTDFYNQPERQVWDADFDSSTQAFARGDVAMILAPSWLIHDLWLINPNLNVGVAPAPQLDVQNPIDWSTHWVEGVNTKSPRTVAAWKLLDYLASSPVLEALNKEQEALRRFGEIYPRANMADLLASSAYTQPYLVNARSAQSFPLNDKTFDEALNDRNITAIETAVTSLTTSTRPADPAQVAADLAETLTENLIEYQYLPDPNAQTPTPISTTINLQP